MAAEPDWLRLQKKIFTRWVNQRLGARRLPPITDVLTDLGKGRTLVNLVEILSDKTCDAKMVDKPRFKAQEIDNMSKALKFIWECGVTMTLKPSAENLLEGDEKNVLGLLWALMMRYLKFQSDDEAEEGQLSAKDALLRWVQLNTVGYKHVEITSYKASFKDGMALCALLHKFKPELIPYDTLLPSDGDDNLLLAMDAAEKAIELEKYVTPADFKKLDEKSLFVYLSEYYTGIQEQRKLALAAKRISKLVQFTVDNDRSKAQYQDSATQIHTRSAAAVKLMTDLREKDNTMKGAQSNLTQFNTFRATEKRALLSELIKLEALYTNLATRLVDNNRPPYVPEDESKSLESLIAGLDSLTATEQTVALELHAEVSRQLKLQRQDRMHKSRFKTLCQWVQEHTDSLPDVSKVTSSGDARHALKFLDACHKESAALKAGSVATLCKLGAELESEKFEFIAEVKQRETEVGERFEDLDKLMASKQAPFEDALAREEFKENLRLSVQVHSDLCKQLQAWGDERKAYLRTKETIASSDEALLQISLLEAFREEKNDMAAGSVTSLKQLGAEIRSAEYKSEFSQWKYEKPQEVTALEQAVDALWAEFDTLSQDKQTLLDDHLARELYAEETRLIAGQHVDKSKQILAWAAEKNAYLQVREPCDTVGDAQFLISTLDTFVKEKDAMTATNVASLQQLGKTVLSRKYATSFSSYAFEHPQDIKSREAEVLQEWATLDALAADKAPFLQDHLARNTFQNKIRLWVSSHKDMSAKLEAWLADRERYLNTREDIASVQAAQLQRSLLDAYRQEASDAKQGALASLKQLGGETREAVYKTKHSEWTLPADVKDAVSALEQAADDTFEKHAGLAETKQAYLDDALAREQLRSKVLLLADRHAGVFGRMQDWAGQKDTYLKTTEDVHSIADAQVCLRLLEAFDTEREQLWSTTVASLEQLGAEVLATKYNTDLSSWEFPTPATITDSEATLDAAKTSLTSASAAKKKVLDADLAREILRENLRLDFASESTAYERFVKDTCIFVGARSDDPTAGFTLQQFEQLGSEQATECTSIRADSKNLTAAYEKPFNELASYGSTDNPYTTLTVESLKMLEQDLEVALDTRDQDYQTGLARLHADDALCKKLSEEAATVLKDINSSLGHLTRPQGTLQEQLALVVRLREESKGLATKLASVQRLDEELAQRNVTFNPHSTVTYKDLEVQLRDYCEILEQKQPLIEQEIEFKKLRGVSSEQLAEMEQFFKQFDKDGSNSIEKKELKACLYSLGEELSNAEIGELFATYGTGDKLVLEQFRELMVQLLGVSHTKENISEAFFYLSRSKEHAPLDVLDKHFKPDEVAFLKQTTPPTPEGIPFPEFVEIAFSR
eukprot:m.236470 g.236470  ORF g.236470 m.236470 type:complete len:1366 (+) comp18939_c2_seq7:236-4333(+)